METPTESAPTAPTSETVAAVGASGATDRHTPHDLSCILSYSVGILTFACEDLLGEQHVAQHEWLSVEAVRLCLKRLAADLENRRPSVSAYEDCFQSCDLYSDALSCLCERIDRLHVESRVHPANRASLWISLEIVTDVKRRARTEYDRHTA